MMLLQGRTTKVALCVVVFFVASGFAGVFPIDVANPSFETLPRGGLPGFCGTGCSFSAGAIPGWIDTGQGGQMQPGTVFNFVPDGITTAWSNGGTIEQTVSAKVVDGATYTLTVDLGQRNDGPSFAASADLLLGGGTVIPAIGNPPALGNWSLHTATFTGTAANAGEMITIQLNSSGVQGNFDNVHLTTTVPEPSSMLLLGSGVLVLVQGLRRKLL